MTLDAFYLRLYGVGDMVKDHSDREETCCCRYMGYSFRLATRVLLYAPSHRQEDRGNLQLSQYRLLFLISSKGSFMYYPTDRIAHTTDFVTPVVEHWLKQEISQWIHNEGSIQQPITTMSGCSTTKEVIMI